MMHLQNDRISLRAVEPEDIDVLFELENDPGLWKYSNRVQPYSKDLLKRYLDNAHQHILESRQVKLSMVNSKSAVVGFIDLFDYEPLHHRAGVGLAVRKEHQTQGYGAASLDLIEVYARRYLHLHQLYAHISSENKISIRLFEGQAYSFVGTKKDWNFYDGEFHDELIYQKII